MIICPPLVVPFNNNCNAIPLCLPVVKPCMTQCLNLGRDVEFECLDEFVAHVKPYVTYKEGVERLASPDKAILIAVNEALQDFTRHAMLLRRRATLTAQNGVVDYYITPLDNEQIHRIESVCVTTGCNVALPDDCSIQSPFNTFQNVSTKNTVCIPLESGMCCDDYNLQRLGFTLEIPNKIVFSSAYQCDGATIEVKYIAESTRNACLIDKQIIERYRMAIVMKAVSILQTMPSWEWTAPNYGLNAQRVYDKLLTEAKIDAARKFTRGKMPLVRSRGFM